MKKGIINKLFICMCMIILCNSAAFCCWEEMIPEVSASSSDSGNDGYIEWDCLAIAGGYNGLYTSAIAYPTTLGRTSMSYKSFYYDVFCYRKIGYKWSDATTPQPATFMLSWSGHSIGYSLAVAETVYDYCKSEENGEATVLSSDFSDYNDKWRAISRRGAHCPANPPVDQEGERSESETIEVEPGLPGSINGTMTWATFSMDRSQTRVISGYEASDTSVISESVAIFNHTGSGDSSNKQVDAIAHHYSVIDLSFQRGIFLGLGIDGHVMNQSRSLVFDIEKL